MIKHNLPLITEQDVKAVENVLHSGWIAHGPQVSHLEKDFAGFLGGGKACGCSSGTAALFLALHGLEIGKGHKVAVPTYACSALLNAVYMACAEPLVLDVRPGDFSLDPKQDFSEADAAVAVHIFGAKADIKQIKEKVPIVIEDCCQSLGGMQDGKPLGIEGDAAIFSFYATKIITCGHGGLIWDRNGRIADKALDYREFDNRPTYKPRFNLYLSDIQAAMAREQFFRIDQIRSRRYRIASKYKAALPKGFDSQAWDWDEEPMIYRFVLSLKNSEQRDRLLDFLQKAGIEARVPIERFELLHRYLGLAPELFPVAEKLADTTLSIPLYPGLSDGQVDYICEKIAMMDTL